MTVTLRQFHRELARLRRAADQGAEIVVKDRNGETYIFKRRDQPRSTMADLVGHLAGSVTTGRRVKTLAGYGRPR